MNGHTILAIVFLLIIIIVGLAYFDPQILNSMKINNFISTSAKFQTQLSSGPTFEYGNMQPDAICQNFCARLCASDNMVYAYSKVNATTTDAYNNQIEVCDCGCN